MPGRGVRVLRAGFTPVKGTRHLELPEVVLDEHGAVGDRRLCLVDVEQRRVLRTVQHPGLVAVHAGVSGDVLTVRIPDGRTAAGPIVGAGPHASGVNRLTVDYWGRSADVELLDGPHAALLAAHLGRPVALAAAPARAVVYGAGVTLVTRSSLEDLAARTGGTVDAARFRATFVVETDQPPYAEDAWTGRELVLGGATVRVGSPIGRCAVIDLDPTTGARDGRLLRALASYRPRNEAGEPCFGVYAEVVRAGSVRPEPPSAS